MLSTPQRDKLLERFRRLAEQLVAIDPSVVVRMTSTDPVQVTATGQPANQAALNAILAGWSWTPRRSRTVAAIQADIDILLDTAAKDKAALHKLLAYLATQDAAILRKLGQAIDGDEPVP